MVERGSQGGRVRRALAGWTGRGAAQAPDPSVVALVEAVLPLVADPARWAVYTVPGPRELPGPDAPRWRRDRWWRDHVSAVGGALIVLDPEMDPAAVRQAVDLLSACAVARDRGTTDAATIAGWAGVTGPVAAWPPGRPATALEVVGRVAAVVDPGTA